MKNSSKILKISMALTLCVLMLLSLVACGASGKSVANDANGKVEGTKIKWDYKKEDQILTLTGEGNIPSFKSAEEIAWADVATSVKEIVIKTTGTTEIGNYAFYNMTSLKKVTIPEGITKIGKSAFAFCTSLKTVTFPASLTTIGANAFECTGLTHITVPENVKTLGTRAFAHCSSLQNVVVRGAEVNSETFLYCKSIQKVWAPNPAQLNVGRKTPFVPAIIDNSKVADAADPAKEKPAATTPEPDKSTETTKPTDTAAPSETDKKEPADKKDGLGTGEIIAIVALVVLVIGVGVAIVLYIRYDKKHSGNTTTVIKNKDGKGKDGKKSDKNSKNKKK